jgi:nicotinamidase-related amidase
MYTLIVIDMQEGSFSKSDKYDSENIISRINEFSKKVRVRGGNVIFIQHDGTEEEGLLPNSDGWNILSSLDRYAADVVIRKTTNDAFYKTTLDECLKNLGYEEVIFCGWATDFCVDTTIRSAISHEYFVSVASDCHTVSDRPHMRAENVIKHHNWLWSNMLTPRKKVQVLQAIELCL